MADTNWWDGYNQLDLDGPAFAQWARATVPDMLHEIDTLRRRRNKMLKHAETCGASTAEGMRDHLVAALRDTP